MMKTVSQETVHAAYNVFKKAYGSGNKCALPDFKKLVYIESFSHFVYFVTEDEFRRLKLMLGPHGHTCCKVMIEKLPKK